MKILALSIGAVLMAIAKYAHAGAVVVAKDSPIQTVSSEQIKRIFLGSESAIGQTPVTLVVQTNEAVRSDFENKVLAMTGAALEAYWVKQIFTGKAAPPREVAGDLEVRSIVTRTPGAIGYVSDDGVDSSVKVVFRY